MKDLDKEEKEMMKKYSFEEEDEDEAGSKKQLDEEELEQREMIEKLDTSKFEMDLDRMIEKKLREGKTQQDIIKEFFGQQSQSKKAERIPTEEKVSFLDAATLLSDKIYQTPEEKAFHKRTSAEIDNLEVLNEILGDREEESLPRLGNSELHKFKNKLTKQEKAEIEMTRAMLQSQMLVSKTAPPKGAKPTLILKESDVFEEVDLKKEREIMKQRNESLKKQDAETDLAPVLETKEEKIVRLKVESSLKEAKRKEDIVFKEGAKGDAIESDKAMGIYAPEAKPGDKMTPRVRGNMAPKLHQRAFREAMRISQETGLDFEDTREMMKEYIFAMKRIDEENREREEKLKLREKKKKINKLMNDLEEMDIEKDIDYDEKVDIEEATRMNQLFKKKFLDPEDMARIKEDEILGLEEEESFNRSKTGDKEYEIHRIKTQNNVETYMHNIFNTNKQNLMTGVKRDLPILINEVIMNPALTVVYVFWCVLDKKMEAIDADTETVKILQKNLNKFAKYARGKMCRDLQFKFSMDLRFHYAGTSEMAEELAEGFEETGESLVNERVNEDIRNNKIKSKKDLIKSRMAAEEEIDNAYVNIMEKHSNLKALKHSKNIIAKDEGGKRIRNNRTETGEKKKFKRENAGEAFWNSL